MECLPHYQPDVMLNTSASTKAAKDISDPFVVVLQLLFGWSCLPNVSETSAGCSAVRTLVSHQVDMNIAVVTVVVATRQ